MAYDTLEPVADIVFDAEHMLMLPEEVERRGISVWSPKPEPEPEPKEPEQEDDDDDDVRERPTDYEADIRLQMSGEPRKALADVIAAAQDKNWNSINLLEFRWTGDEGNTAQSMGYMRTLMGQMAGSDATVECDLVCQFGQEGVFETRYSGDYARYQAMAGTLETQASQADSAYATLTLRLMFAGGLALNAPELSDLRDAFDLVALGHTDIAAERHDGGP